MLFLIGLVLYLICLCGFGLIPVFAAKLEKRHARRAQKYAAHHFSQTERFRRGFC